jgi:hypothetical protein
MTFRPTRKLGILTAAVVLAVSVFATLALAAGTSFFQGFETDTSGWVAGVTRVASGTNGIISASGSYHAEAAPDAFTRWGGYGGISGCGPSGCAASFPQNGYVTSLDIYLDAENTTRTNDTRFDFSSAINDPAGNHRRDFVFNAGYYNDTDLTGSGPRFVVTASNNAGRDSAFPKNPGRDPFTITNDGWYTFQHTFRNNGGVLAVDLAIKDAAGVVLHSWTLSDATDTVNGTVGSNRYGYFFVQEFSPLAIDNTSRFDVMSTPADKEQCKNDGWKLVVNGAGAPFKNQGQCVKYVTTGK